MQLSIIRQKEREESVRRAAAMQEYQKAKTLERIEAQSNRNEEIRIEKEKIIADRRKMKGELDIKKKQLLETIENLKSQGEFSPTHMKNLMQSQGLNVSDFENTQRSFPLRKSVQGSPSRKESKVPRKIPSLTPTKTKGQRKSPHGSQLYEEKLLLQVQKETRRQYEIYSGLKAKQNADLIALLDKEQEKEEKREKILAGIRNEKQRMEKDEEFAALRAKASAKIIKRAERQKRKLKKLAKKFGIKSNAN